MEVWRSVAVTDIMTNPQKKHEPGSVLAFVMTADQQLVWVLHPTRGWEVPGGKIEAGETPIEALHREVWEEAGVQLRQPQWVAEYQIAVPAIGGGPEVSYKWVYVAQLLHIGERPPTSEVLSVRLAQAESPSTLALDPTVSPIMKDAVYESMWQVLDGFQGEV